MRETHYGKGGNEKIRLSSAYDLTLDKTKVCQVSDLEHSANRFMAPHMHNSLWFKNEKKQNGFAECPRSSTRQTLALLSARSRALGKPPSYIASATHTCTPTPAHTHTASRRPWLHARTSRRPRLHARSGRRSWSQAMPTPAVGTVLRHARASRRHHAHTSCWLPMPTPMSHR